MAVTEQPSTFADLFTLLMNSVRSDSSQTATISQAKRAINMALQDMHLGTDYKVPWAERRAVIITQDDYTTGTVALTQGSTSIVGTSTLWDTNNAFTIKNTRANGKMVFSGDRTPYIVSSVGSDTAITLAQKVTDADATAATYTYYEDEYDLASDFLRPVDMQTFSDVLNISLISRQEFRRRFPVNAIPSSPVAAACLLDFAPVGDATPIRRVRFAPPPNDFIQIPYSYITSLLAVSSTGTGAANLSADTDQPIVPLRYRHAIFYHALYSWYRDKKDDTRSQEAKSEYVDIMSRMMMDAEYGAPRPRLEPRITSYVRNARSPWGGRAAGRRYDGFGRFDRNE